MHEAMDGEACIAQYLLIPEHSGTPVHIELLRANGGVIKLVIMFNTTKDGYVHV